MLTNYAGVFQLVDALQLRYRRRKKRLLISNRAVYSDRGARSIRRLSTPAKGELTFRPG